MDESAVELAVDADVDAVKIHSADLSNPDILDSVASIGKPVSLSVGGSTIDEILQALFTLRRKDVNDIILMHGFQAFPTSIEDSRPNFIRTLIKLFNCPVGYQDHTDGGTDYAYYLPIMAMCAGACILEKHITDDRTLKRVDYESALGPIEFKRFVDMVRRLSTALDGGEVKPLSEPEKKYRKNFKKSIVAACQIEKGKVIKKEMLSFMRTNTDGLPPTKVNTVIGRKCKTNIEQYDILKKNNLE
ncbi:MAG: N-acetylneuraminate synthase family protein [Bacteroidetes bacterium]|nr:N-acetylneuraminate synthase family protein [Bacteroidota bacterium]